MTVTRVGFWRPMFHLPDDRPETKDKRLYWPVRIVQTLDQHPEVAQAQRDLDKYRQTGHSYYISDSDLRRAGAETVEQYLEQALVAAQEHALVDLTLPVPVPETLDHVQAQSLAQWLDDGEVVQSYGGPSICRVCGCLAGSRELVRDGYVYPEGLVHYVRDHRVSVPGLSSDVCGAGCG